MSNKATTRPKADVDNTCTLLIQLGLSHAAELLDGQLSEAVKSSLPAHGVSGQAAADRGQCPGGTTHQYLAEAVRLAEWTNVVQFRFRLPAVDRALAHRDLGNLCLDRANETLLIQGPPGVRKTYLAVALSVRAIQNGFGVTFYRLEELLVALRADAELGPQRLHRKKYLNTGLLIIDEMGFEPMSRQDASLFFRLVSYRYSRGAILITTNKGIKNWTEMLAGDEVLTTAILDRLLPHNHVLNIKGRSCRLRDLEAAVPEVNR